MTIKPAARTVVLTIAEIRTILGCLATEAEAVDEQATDAFECDKLEEYEDMSDRHGMLLLLMDRLEAKI